MDGIAGKMRLPAAVAGSAGVLPRLDRRSSLWKDGPWGRIGPGCFRISGWKQCLRMRSVQLRATASESESMSLKKVIEQVEKMRASAIKEELTVLGVSFTDCFEKHELVLRLATARLRKSKIKVAASVNAHSDKALARMSITRLRSTQASPKDYILVPLRINNQGPFNFILDTASTITLIAPSVVYDRLRLTPNPAQQTVGLFGGGASNQSFLSVNLAQVTLGDHLLNPITALLMDANMLRGWDPSAAGIMGLNVLSQLDVEFDNCKNEMIFYSAGAASRGECNLRGLEKLATSTTILNIMSVKVKIGQAPPEMALLDLGSSLCVATPDVARLAGVPEQIIKSERPALGGGGIGQLAAMQFSSAFVDVDLVTESRDRRLEGAAPFKVRSAQFAVGEVPAIRTAGVRILLGVNVFKNVRMIFSQSSKSVYMEQPKP